MQVHYLEIVTNEVELTCATYAQVHGVEFGPGDPGLGGARTAQLPGGGLIGVRAPMHETELPVVRGFSRSNKYGLGDELRTGARRVLTLAARDNSRRERESVLLAVREELEALKVGLRLAHDLRAFANFKSFENSISLVVDIAKQNEGWLKSQRLRAGPNRRAMPDGPAAPSAP